jgi:DNA-binding NarL/FixJ family response regulator
MRLVVADDSAIVRDGLRHLLEAHGYEIAATAADADELLAAVENARPDVALIDIRMPPTHTTEGLTAAAAIRERNPQVGVLVLSQHVDADYAFTLLREHPSRSGYLLKDRITQLQDAPGRHRPRRPRRVGRRPRARRPAAAPPRHARPPRRAERARAHGARARR